ncbi:MAG: hypothetical protein AAGH76_06080 [Pseudomonadota bacterium]
MLLAILLASIQLLSRQIPFAAAADPAFFDLTPELEQIDVQAYCLDPNADRTPVFECYEVISNKDPDQSIAVTHESGVRIHTTTFAIDSVSKYRFTPTLPGRWVGPDGMVLTASDIRPTYAAGFVKAKGAFWARSATGAVFAPQYVMYYDSDIEGGIDEFIRGHGFTGFHIANLRDFLVNPAFFEAVVIQTYRAGGVTHFWLWGDEQRGQTPNSYSGDVETLYRAIGARLGPLPGWTVGFGFDLYEWADDAAVDNFRLALEATSSYRHLIGARGNKNRYEEVYPDADFASWEWHRPTLHDYHQHVERARGRPAFSEDRFRIRTATRYPEKDYDEDLTRRGMWESLVAGGVANIWGNQDSTGRFSRAYKNREQLLLFRDTVDRYLSADMTQSLITDKGQACLVGDESVLCYGSDTRRLRLPEQISGRIQSAWLLDTITGEETAVSLEGLSKPEVVAPSLGDWALVGALD